jgi:hypothetical protein
VDDDARDADFFLRVKNPTFLRAPRLSQTLDLFDVEGRFGAAAGIEWSRQARLGAGPVWTVGAGLQWVHPDDFRYLDRGLYDDAGTVELELSAGVRTAGAWRLGLRGTAAGGLAYNRDGLAASGRPDLDPFYGRGTIEGTARRALGRRLDFGLRLFAGAAGGEHDAAKQRQIYVQGADPLALLGNPFLRSRGALLVGDDFRYHAPGGGGVRGVDPRVSAAALLGGSVELERTMLRRPEGRLFSRVSLAAFGDAARVIGDGVEPIVGERLRWLADAGMGLRAEHRIGETRFVTRLDLPLWVSEPLVAHDRDAGDEEVAFRWTFGFAPSW